MNDKQLTQAELDALSRATRDAFEAATKDAHGEPREFDATELQDSDSYRDFVNQQS